MGYSLGVDLGTTFVAAAVAQDSGVEMVALGDGSMAAPAVVYFRDDGSLVTGDAAARRAVSHPDRVAREIKRSLGNPTPVMLGGRPHAVTDLLGVLLQNVLARVTESQDGEPDVVALTHPANWGPFRRALFEDVAQVAGLSRLVYATEPAAAAAHHASTRRLTEGEVIAVYDLGGGTFDATVLRRDADGFQILGAPEGIERLGGVDFDESILAHVNYLAGGPLAELDLSDPSTVVALARLRQDCVLAKEALSVDLEVTIPVFLPDRHLNVPLTRAEFEGMIRAPIESTIGTLGRVLRAAQVEVSGVAAVLLVGGSSRIPLISRMVSEEFGRPIVVGTHPKHAVALGAALLAEVHRTSRAVDTSSHERMATPAPGAREAVERSAGARVPAVVAAPSAAPAPAVDLAGAPPSSDVAAAPVRPRPAPVPARANALADQREVVPAAMGGPRNDAGGVRGTGGGPSAAVGSPAPPAPSPPLTPPGPQPRPGRRLPLVIAIVALMLVVAAGVAVHLLRPRSPDAGQPVAQGGGGTSTASTAPAPSAGPSAGETVAPSVPIPPLGGTVPVGPSPNFVVAGPNGRQLYIASRDAGVVTVVDTAVDKVTATIPIDAGPPQFLTFSPDGRKAYVSVWNNARTVAAVSVLDTTKNKVVATIPVRTRPYLAAVAPDGRHVYVPSHDTGTVSVIDTDSDKVTTEFPVPANPHSIAFAPDGARVYIADHESNLVSVVETAGNTVLATIPVPRSPHNVAVHPTRPLAVVASYDAASASVIDTDANAVIATVPVGKNPQHVAISADGRFAYVTNNGDNSVSVIALDDFTVTATIPTGASPTSVAVLPNGTKGYVSDLDAGALTVLDLAG
ncbi:MAG: beta-propeller repeat protein [Modestobacter sp.]|nr:beta-propeller repeat protein [Modestobacter sp.]